MIALAILIGIGGALGVSSFNVKTPVTGTLLVIVASFESVLILGGFSLLSRKRHIPSTSESN